MSERPSLNRQYKQGLIVEATKRVMRKQGLSDCTVRNIAVEAKVSSGSIHYYFDDVNDLVDAAFLGLTRDYVEKVALPDVHGMPPAQAFWETVNRYLTPFIEHPSMGSLWYDFAASRARSSAATVVSESISLLRSLFRPRLIDVDPTLADRDEPVVAYLLGIVLVQGFEQIESSRVVEPLSRITGIAPGAGVDFGSVCAICSMEKEPDRRPVLTWH